MSGKGLGVRQKVWVNGEGSGWTSKGLGVRRGIWVCGEESGRTGDEPHQEYLYFCACNPRLERLSAAPRTFANYAFLVAFPNLSWIQSLLHLTEKCQVPSAHRQSQKLRVVSDEEGTPHPTPP